MARTETCFSDTASEQKIPPMNQLDKAIHKTDLSSRCFRAFLRSLSRVVGRTVGSNQRMETTGLSHFAFVVLVSLELL